MHELGVVFHIMDSLETIAGQNDVTGITKVVLELGEVSTVIESYLQSCWKWACHKNWACRESGACRESEACQTNEAGRKNEAGRTNEADHKSHLFQDTELVVEKLPAITYCEGCGQTYPTVTYGKICPHCGSPDTWLLQGNEFNIKEIEVY